MPFFKILIVTAFAASVLLPATVIARPGDGKRTRIVVHPKHPSKVRSGPYGFLPGYRPQPYIAEWRDRSPRHGGGDFSRNRRYWSGGEVRYGWGYPQYFRGRWNGGSFGPCWSQTPIGPLWNCGM
jgi:hypothetical protein